MEANFQDWLTKAEVASQLRVSEKTVENWAKEKRLQQGARRRPGVPPQAVYHPEDVERIRQDRLHKMQQAFVVPGPLPESEESTSVLKRTAPADNPLSSG